MRAQPASSSGAITPGALSAWPGAALAAAAAAPASIIASRLETCIAPAPYRFAR
jgi:hypothetical protein